MTNECIYKPKRGYTVNPDVTFQAYFQPAKFTKKIAFTFKTLKAEVCAYRNQMCTCESKETCKCDMEEGSFCKQQYRTEKVYFLVYDDTQKPTPMPHYPPPRPYKPPHSYPPYKYHYFTPPPQTIPPPPPPTLPPTPPPPPPPPPPSGGYGIYEIPGSNRNPPPSGGNIYHIPTPKKRSMMLDYLIGGGGDNNMMMMNPSMGLFSKLMGGDGDDDKKDNNFLMYYLMHHLKNQHRYYPQSHYPHHPHHPHPPTPPPPPKTTPAPETQATEATTEAVPEVGSYFDPKILMYMMTKNAGYGNKGLYQLLPYLTGKGGSKLKLESLFVKIPNGCSCEEKKGRNIDPLLKYLLFQQGIPYGKFTGHSNPFDSLHKTPFNLFSY